MSKKNKKRFSNMDNKNIKEQSDKKLERENPEDIGVEDVNLEDAENSEEVEEVKDEANELMTKNAKLEEDLAKEKKEYLFLMAEFDNYRKRTLKEKSEIIKNGAENAMKGILPIVDDFERGIQAMNESDDVEAVKEGLNLIYNKFIKYLEQNGVKPIDTENGTEFDTDKHEAITAYPTDDESMKGKIIDTVQKGYTLNDKVLRHSKVVVGQ